MRKKKSKRLALKLMLGFFLLVAIATVVFYITGSKKVCPFECCTNEVNYIDKPCVAEGFSCSANTCKPTGCFKSREFTCPFDECSVTAVFKATRQVASVDPKNGLDAKFMLNPDILLGGSSIYSEQYLTRENNLNFEHTFTASKGDTLKFSYSLFDEGCKVAENVVQPNKPGWKVYGLGSYSCDMPVDNINIDTWEMVVCKG